MINNPFETIEERLINIEGLLLDLKEHPKPLTPKQLGNERLTRNELSKRFKISLGTIHNLMKSGKLPYEKIGRKTLFKVDEVEAFFAGNKKRLNP